MEKIEGEKGTSNNYLIGENSESIKSIVQIDVRGAVTLAATIISFLLILTYSQTDNSINDIDLPVNIKANANTISLEQVLILFAIGIVSLTAFIIIENRAKYPLVDFRLLMNKAILPANLIIMIFGISMFTIFQTVPYTYKNSRTNWIWRKCYYCRKHSTAVCTDTFDRWFHFRLFNI